MIAVVMIVAVALVGKVSTVVGIVVMAAGSYVPGEVVVPLVSVVVSFVVSIVV
jgi:hypothetical protein